MLDELINIYRWLRSNDPIQDLLVFFLQLAIGNIPLLLFDVGHVVGLPRYVSARCHSVVRGYMKHLGQLLLIVYTLLLLVRTLPAYDFLNLLKENPILPLDLSIAILL